MKAVVVVHRHGHVVKEDTLGADSLWPLVIAVCMASGAPRLQTTLWLVRLFTFEDFNDQRCGDGYLTFFQAGVLDTLLRQDNTALPRMVRRVLGIWRWCWCW